MGSTKEIDLEIEQLLSALNGSESLPGFMARVSPKFPAPPHLKPILDLVEKARHQRVRACISAPPRHGKTFSLLHALAWWIQNTPADCSGFFSYGDDLARSKSRIARNLALEAGVKLSPDSKSLSEWRTAQGGGLIAGGIGGALTGQGISGLLVIDDPFKNREEADSRLMRERVWSWLNEVALTRLEGGSCIVIQTRWHPDDLIGRLEAQGDWEIINLPAIAEESDLLGRKPGEALWPSEYPIEELQAIKDQIGEWSFASLYQGRPRPKGSSVFGEPTFFDLDEWKPSGARILIGADPAASEKTSADYSVACVMAIEGDRARILDVWRGQVTVPKFCEELRRLSKKYSHSSIGVEAVAGFKAVPQLLRSIDPTLRITEVKLRGDKFLRAQNVAAAWNAGKVLLPTNAPWAEAFIDEVCAFTGVKDRHDDQVDAMAHAFNSLMGGRAQATHLSRGAFAKPRKGPTDHYGRPLGVSPA